MKTHLFEYNGVLLSIAYTPGVIPTFHSVHVTDEKFRTVGQDLAPMLKDTLLICGRGRRSVDAKSFLSAITEELPL